MPKAELAPFYTPEEERIQSECGLFAVYLNDPNDPTIDIYSMTYKAGTALQHRAEGATGMVVSNGESSNRVRELGTVAVALQEGRNMPMVKNPHLAVLHTRYPTAGRANHKGNIQPLLVDGIWGAHHGNFTNAIQMKEEIGILPEGDSYPDSDSWIALNLIAKSKGSKLWEKVVNAQKKFEGGWAIVVTDGKELVVALDPYGIRPMSVGRIGDEANPSGWVFSVESCAFNKLPVSDFWEVLPGETINVNSSGIETVGLSPNKEQMSCIFEFIYMMWPTSKFMGQMVHEVRRKAGHLLWQEAPVELRDGKKIIVMPIPDSGRSGALGYFHQAQAAIGLQAQWDEGILANRYYGRNFIKSTGMRTADLKYDGIPQIFNGETVVWVDDSVVRGDTQKALAKWGFLAGAKNVHVRSLSPEIKHPCFWGIAFPSYNELLANKFPNIEDREKYLGVTSLRHLSIEGLIKAVGVSKNRLCTHCLDGKGPPMKNKGTIFLKEA